MPTSAELHTEMGAYLHLLGYGRFDQKDENDRQRALATSYEQFCQKNGRQNMMVDDIRVMREQTAKSPEALGRMRELAIIPDGQKPSSYDATVVQMGLAARNVPVAITGELNAFNVRALQQLTDPRPQTEPQARTAAASAPGRAAFNAASRYDPQAAEAQSYLRVLGYNGTDGKPDTGKIDGIKGPLTTTALEQFSKENKLPKDAPMSEIITVLKSKALAGPGLARMEDIMGKPVIGTGVNQDVKAVQVALRSNGMQVPTTGRPESNTVASIHVLQSRLPQSETPAVAAPSGNASAPVPAPAETEPAAPENSTQTPQASSAATPAVSALNPNDLQAMAAETRQMVAEQTQQVQAVEQERPQQRRETNAPAPAQAWEAEAPVRVGGGRYLSAPSGAFTRNAGQTWSTPPGSTDRQMEAMERREKIQPERNLRQGISEVERGLNQLSDGNKNNDLSGLANVLLGGMKTPGLGGR